MTAWASYAQCLRAWELERAAREAAEATVQELRGALTAFGHHADDCAYALTVCTCGFTDAMRRLLP